MGSHHANDSRAMPLSEFIAETISMLKNAPDECAPDYQRFFSKFNDDAASSH
jgi:hypothetical protein